MRILHTADWHVGKKLGRVDRQIEYENAIDEVVAIARDQKVDLVIVAGDLFDRANTPLDSMGLVVDGLIRLADAAGKVVAMPGNHDSAPLFEFLAPLLESRGVLLSPRLKRPGEGGVVSVPSRDGSETASIAVLPFVHEADVVEDFMDESAEWFKEYADRVKAVAAALCAAIDPKTVGILTGHFFVDGAEVGGGERRMHIGPQFAVTNQAIPPAIHYAALGHIHKPQTIAGSAVPARYSGSLIHLDFSERGHDKGVVIIDAKPGAPAKVHPVTFSSGRSLIRVEDDLESLEKRASEFGDAYLDVRVLTDGPVLGLAETVRRILPNALMVQAIYERLPTEVALSSSERSLSESYSDYFTHRHGTEIPKDLSDMVRALEEEVVRAAS